MNEHVVVRHDGAPLVVAGVTDFSAHHFDPAHRSDPAGRARRRARRGAASACCSRTSRAAPRPPSAAGFDLQLSGHTHGGQFWPWNLFVPLQQPFTAGLHRLRRLWVYTSRGTGYWGPPKRFGAPSEITRLRLVAMRPARGGARGGRPTRSGVAVAGRLRQRRVLQFAGFGRRPAAAHREESHRVHFRSFCAGRARGHRLGRVLPFGSLGGMLPLVLMFVVLYFVMIRPQMKRQKEHKAMIEALAKGDEVVTAGGVLGKVSKIGESYLHVEVANGVEMQVQRAPSCRCCPRARSSRRGVARAPRARGARTMNRYPLWKYAILVIALLVGADLHAAQLLRRGAGGAGVERQGHAQARRRRSRRASSRSCARPA